MSNPTRILMLEDSPTDAELAEREVRRGGIDYVSKRVETAEAYEEALTSFRPEIILSDYNLPGFDGLAALQIRNLHHQLIPFIFVSGALGEERAVDAVRDGATDYVLKNRLSRLVPAIRRALRESEDRAERRLSDAALLRRAEFEHLISSLSTRFASVSAAELDKELSSALESIGVFVEADRSFLIQCSEDGAVTHHTIEWCANGITGLPDQQESSPCTRFPWLLERLRRGEPVTIHDPASLPATAMGEREWMQEQGADSFVTVPIMVEAAMIGYVGFSPLRERRKQGSDAVTLLQIAGEIFGSAILRIKAAASLENERDFVTKIIDTAESLIVVLDSEGCFVRVNPAFTRTTGFTIGDLHALHLWDVVPPVRIDRVQAAFARALTAPLKEHRGILLTREGDERSIVWQITPFWTASRQFVVGVGIDTTEQDRMLEERTRFKSQLDQTTRLDSLGRLAATIAHEFNNVLMGIKPFTRVLEKRWAHDTGVLDVASQIAKSVNRGERITREILRFTRPAEATLVKMDLKDWLTAFVKETASVLTDRVTLGLRLPSEDVIISADGTPLHQAMSNLVLNARDALMDGGSITITLDHPAARSDPEDHAYVQLSVTDTGKGIPPEILPHIFEPLFTTKKAGTGIGLAVTWQIIHAHGGYIFAESEVGQGTSFHLFFPIPEAETEEVAIGASKSEMELV